MAEFGVLKQVNLRDIWGAEASDFTPWLSDHLSAIGNELGLSLTLESREAPVGRYSLDVLARDDKSKRLVAIENQLTPADHGHLGQLITYASHFDAAVAVWIASNFNPEHLAALDWLNEQSSNEVEFYGVSVEVLQIDESRPAFSFRIVACPERWLKGQPSASAKPSERGEAYRSFFLGLLKDLREKYKFTDAKASGPASWYTFASGDSRFRYEASFAKGGRVRAGLYIDNGDYDANKALFDSLAAEKDELEKQYGIPFEWERRDGKQASRIAVYRSGSISSSDTLEDIKQWEIEQLLKFQKIFGPRISALVP